MTLKENLCMEIAKHPHIDYELHTILVMCLPKLTKKELIEIVELLGDIKND